MANTLEVQYRVERSVVEEYNDCEKDAWHTEVETFPVLHEAIEFARIGEEPKIYLEVFNPIEEKWETLLSFTLDAARQIEVEPED